MDNQQVATLRSLFITVNCSTCFGWFLHPSSGAQNYIYSIWCLSDRYYYLPLSWRSWDVLVIHHTPLGYYKPISGNFLRTLQDKLSALSSDFRLSFVFLNLEDETVSLS